MKYDLCFGTSEHSWQQISNSELCVINVHRTRDGIMLIVKRSAKYLNRLFKSPHTWVKESAAKYMIDCVFEQEFSDQIYFDYPRRDEIFVDVRNFIKGKEDDYSQIIIEVPLTKIDSLPDEIFQFILMNLDKLT